MWNTSYEFKRRGSSAREQMIVDFSKIAVIWHKELELGTHHVLLPLNPGIQRGLMELGIICANNEVLYRLVSAQGLEKPRHEHRSHVLNLLGVSTHTIRSVIQDAPSDGRKREGKGWGNIFILEK